MTTKRFIPLLCAGIAAGVFVFSCGRSTPIPTDSAILAGYIVPGEKTDLKTFHDKHEKNKVNCIVCHHKNYNDERDKKCGNCHDAKDETVQKTCTTCHTAKNK